ncbi:hypothetical protein [Devosia sp. A16]|uniref:hypothetical protein n=1 Tax=Devosia sp. A16 TaxID=1736675 RepID=UPI0006D7D905|nr:hypothetical protein [Devosia sp. A16]
MTWIALFAGFGFLVGALFCCAEALVGWHLKAGPYVVLVPEQDGDSFWVRFAVEVRDPSNKVERRWLKGAAALAALGLLLVLGPLLVQLD